MRWLIRIHIAIFFMALTALAPARVFAANLLEVYQQAQQSDAAYQEAVMQRCSVQEGVPISIAALLPNISAQVNPSVTRISNSGSSVLTEVNGNAINPRNTTQRSYTMQLNATQTVFNFAQFAQVAGSLATSKGADATLNAAAQSLMVRVAKAYLAVLQDEDNLLYSEASKNAFKAQLDEVKQQHEVGIKSMTDVYTAQARYDSAIANCLAVQTTLENDRENLRVITGKYYPHLARLSENFPLVSPHPVDTETWVKRALEQNWTIKASQYKMQSAKQNIHQQFAGHLPTLQVQGLIERQYNDYINGYNPYVQRNGPSLMYEKQVGLNLNVPLFAGGGVVAQTNKATYDYEVTQQQLEQTIRAVVNIARQSFLNVMSGSSKVSADKHAVTSNLHSLQGMEENYKAGNEILFNVLNQQQILLSAQTQYTADRYAYVNNILLLKQAAGTLSFDDLRAINAWLADKEPSAFGVEHIEKIYFKRRPVKKQVSHKQVVKKKVVASKKIINTKLSSHKTSKKSHVKSSHTHVIAKVRSRRSLCTSYEDQYSPHQLPILLLNSSSVSTAADP